MLLKRPGTFGRLWVVAVIHLRNNPLAASPLAFALPAALVCWQRHVRYPLLGIPASAIHALFHDSTPLSRHNDSPTVTGLTVGLSPFRYAWCAYVARLSAAGTYGRSTTMTASS